MVNVLVVGGAGYIGSHTCLDLAARGHNPVVYDNLSNGHAEFVQWGPLEVGDIRDRERLDEVIARYRPRCVVHFAALIEVGASIEDPIGFFDNNIAGTMTLLAACQDGGVENFVFSSTCATYGLPQTVPIAETNVQEPINPYGRSKHIVEQILDDLDTHCGLKAVRLRYFNAAGADPQARVGEWHSPETHIVPLAIETAFGRRGAFRIFGSDYDTRDGTCVRDYVHVMDLADAHSRAVEYLLSGGGSTSLNLGTGSGTSVAELIGMVEKVSGRRLAVQHAPRRAGDSPVLVADNSLAKRTLGWVPRYGLKDIVASAWNWHARDVEMLRRSA